MSFHRKGRERQKWFLLLAPVLTVVALVFVGMVAISFVSSTAAPVTSLSLRGSQALRSGAFSEEEKVDGEPVTRKHGVAVGKTPVDSQRVNSLVELKQSLFFRVQNRETKRWLTCGGSTLVGASSRTLLIYQDSRFRVWVFQGALRMYLAVDRNSTVTMDHPAPPVKDAWILRSTSPGVFVLQMRKSELFVRTDVTSSGDAILKVDAVNEQDAATWEIFVDSQDGCRTAPNAINRLQPLLEARLLTEENKSAVEELRSRCWGAIPTVHARLRHALLAHDSDTAVANITIFGSPKPLVVPMPNDPTDPFDTFIISRRTFVNWASIAGLQPYVIVDDEGNRKLIASINAELGGSCGNGECDRVFNRIEVGNIYELNSEFNQPTYRGLFQQAFRQYSTASVVMYANSDILFTSSVVETIRAVEHFFTAERKRKPQMRGWFVVGRRTNVKVDADWQIDGERGAAQWEDDLEGRIARSGELFQTFAEDYFIVSRELFDWETIPAFVVGGTAFDNWITTQAVKLAKAGAAVAVDATLTLTAIHQNHGVKMKASHAHPKSKFNNALVRVNGGWALGHTTDCPYFTTRNTTGAVIAVQKSNLLHP